jgi:hypothetical protein
MARIFGFGLTALVLLLLCVGAAVVDGQGQWRASVCTDVIRMQFMGRMDGSKASAAALLLHQFHGQLRAGLSLALLALLAGP